MNLLLSFSEYCEISHGMGAGNGNDKDTDNLDAPFLPDKPNLNLLRVKAMFLTDPNQTDVITYLIEQCNPQMITALMNYFDKDASIQKLLIKRLDKLDRESRGKTEKTELDKENKKSSLYDILIAEMRLKGYESDSEFYNYIQMDRRTFAKLRKPDAEISRENALWLTVGFELNYPEGQEFLGKLGYTFRQTDQRERLIVHIMKTREYTFAHMQEVLFSFNQKVFGVPE